MTWVERRLRKALHGGLTRAYGRVRVDADAYLAHLQRAHRLPIQTFGDMFYLPQEAVDELAGQSVRAATRIAAIEGAGLGIGGMLTVLPDMGILTAIVLRMIQKLSLIHGFTYATDEEVATLWLAAASAAGLDLGRELVQKEAVERFVPRVIERMAAKASAEVCEKWTVRLVPVVSGALGATLNYYFVREWGRRAQQHFRERHLEVRQQMALATSPALIPFPDKEALRP